MPLIEDMPFDEAVAAAGPREHDDGLRGATLVELVVAGVVLLLGIGAMASTTWRAHAVVDHASERRAAHAALRSMAAEITALAAEPVLSDDIGHETWAWRFSTHFAPGGSPGPNFDVPGLEALPGAASVGTVEVICDETLGDETLGVTLGMPRDLDGDGEATSKDARDTAGVLPVVIRLAWTGVSGPSHLEHAFYVSGF